MLCVCSPLWCVQLLYGHHYRQRWGNWNVWLEYCCRLGQYSWYESEHGLKFHLPQEIATSKFNPNWSIHSDLVQLIKKDFNNFARNVPLVLDLILYSYCITLQKRVMVMVIFVISLHYLSIALMKDCLSYLFKMWLVENRLWRKKSKDWCWSSIWGCSKSDWLSGSTRGHTWLH